MPNHLGLCAVPALPILAKNAKVTYSTAAFVKLRNAQNQTHPTHPTITLILSNKRLVSETAAKGVVRILQTEIATQGAHSCPACTRITSYNTVIPNLGSFIQHLSSLREYARTSVVETLALDSGFSEEVIEGVARKKSVPDFASQRIETACKNLYGQHLGRWNLAFRPLLPQECDPLPGADSRYSVSDVYVREFCTVANGCSG